jgi:catecholate siderophore receptor
MIESRNALRGAIRRALEIEPAKSVRPTAPMIASALLASMTLSPSVWAQATPAPEKTLSTIKVQDEAEAQSETTQIGKMPQSLRDVPQSMTVINRQLLDAQSATRLTDALRNVPGITISAGEGGQIGDNINLRGFSARTDLFLDGFRDRGQYSRDTFFLNSVEVLKGPSSILFGRGSTGGVINQTSKKPQLRNSAEVAAAIGTDNYYRLTGDVNYQLSDDSALRIVAMGHEAESTRDVVESKRYGISPSIRFGIGTDTEITASALLQRNRDIPDYGFPMVFSEGEILHPVDAPANRFYGFTNDRFDQDVSNLNLTIQQRLGDSATLTNQSQYTDYRTAASPSPLGGFVDPITGQPELVNVAIPAGRSLDSLWRVRQQRDRVVSDTSLFNQTNLTLIIPGAWAQTLITGVELGRDTYRNDSYTTRNITNPAGQGGNVDPLPAVNLGNPTYLAKPTAGGNVLRVPASRTEATGDTVAAYINDQIDITSQWKLVLGLRWDQFKAEQQAITYTFPATIASPANPVPTSFGFTTLSRKDTMLSKRAGLIWQPDEAQTYYASYGTSFNPAGETLTLAQNASRLDPEENRSYEIGTKQTLLNNALMLTGAVFRVEKTNARTTDPANSTVQILDGLTRVDGVEFSAMGSITENWQVTAGYALLDAEIVRSNDVGTGVSATISSEGKVPQNVPRRSFSAWSTYRFAEDWEVGGGAVHSSYRFVNNFETAAIEGYTRYDLTAAYIQETFDVRLNVLNATDKVYFETASAGRATPAEGRAVVARFAYRFQ